MKQENVSIITSSDNMNAYITLSKPENKENYTTDQILELLSQKGIIYGINYDAIEEIVKSKIYDRKVKIASGENPIDGKDGNIEFHFDCEKEHRPKILENGRVDYRNFDIIENVKKGQILCTLIPPTSGVVGVNVFGEDVPPKKGKEFKLPVGKNVEVSEDGNSLISKIDGQISYLNEKINIYDTYEINGDVDNSTGNINFVGNVVIRGNVLSGFTVLAGGNIEIWGVVESAKVVCAGNIIIRRGVLGNNKAIIKCDGDIFARFIESSYVEAKNNITAETIMHSTVKCGEQLTLEGKNGLLVGGKSTVGKEIIAKVLGSQMHTVTNIEVGINAELREESKGIKDELDKMVEGMKKSDQIISILTKLDSNNMLADDKKDILDKTLKTKQFYENKIEELNETLENIQYELCKESDGKIRCNGIIYPGVRITIGSATKYIRDEIQYCLLYCDGVDIKCLPL